LIGSPFSRFHTITVPASSPVMHVAPSRDRSRFVIHSVCASSVRVGLTTPTLASSGAGILLLRPFNKAIVTAFSATVSSPCGLANGSQYRTVWS
jgi:hypothetical protein